MDFFPCLLALAPCESAAVDFWSVLLHLLKVCEATTFRQSHPNC